MLSFAGRDNTIDTSALVKPAPPGGQWTRAFATHRVRLVTEVWEFFAGLIVHLASVTTASCVQSQVRTIVVLVAMPRQYLQAPTAAMTAACVSKGDAAGGKAVLHILVAHGVLRGPVVTAGLTVPRASMILDCLVVKTLSLAQS